MKQWVEDNNVVVLKADKSQDSPEVDQLLLELGRVSKGIPYYALMKPKQSAIHFEGVFTSTSQFLSQFRNDDSDQTNPIDEDSQKVGKNLSTNDSQALVELPRP